MIQERVYRKEMGGNLDAFILEIEETNLWIAVSKGFLNKKIKKDLEDYLISKRNILKEYLTLDPEFKTSLESYKSFESAPGFIKQMSKYSSLVNVGPMAGVAGSFSLLAGEFLKDKGIPEIIIENGGDIFVHGKESLTVGVYAGSSIFTNKIKLELNLGKKDFGICSSSGSFGHSLSFGKADLVTIVAENVIMADLFATDICNKVNNKNDIEKTINELKNTKEVSGALIILEDKLGAFGNLKILGRN